MNKEEISQAQNQIHHSFFAFRNGAVAESLLKSGIPFRQVFGLLLPQIKQIADSLTKDFDLASCLWGNKECREARLLAIYLFPESDLNKEEAIELISDVKTIEEAEILPFRLLRKLSFAKELTDLNSGIYKDLSPESIYCLEMLKKNIYS